MFPMDTNFDSDFRTYQKAFICADQDDLYINGDYNSKTARLFNIQFIKCHDRPDCKKPDEITKILRDKFIIFAYN